MGEASWATSAATRASMQGNRSVDTKPEVALRSALHREGLRFRKNYRITTPSRTVCADVVFTRWKVAVFLDGCYWHVCPDHGHYPAGKNSAYWREKLSGNVNRDIVNSDALRQDGWIVIRIWEHQPIEEAVATICEELAAARIR